MTNDDELFRGRLRDGRRIEEGPAPLAEVYDGFEHAEAGLADLPGGVMSMIWSWECKDRAEFCLMSGFKRFHPVQMDANPALAHALV
jgi:hypothetical protein